MRIIYISALASHRIIDSIHRKTGTNPGYAVQKFSRLVVQGLISNEVETMALSNPPVTRRECKSLWVNIKREKEEGIEFRYIPFLNMPIIKHVCVFLYTFFYVLFWGLFNKRDKAIICDVLSISSCLGALIASKVNGLKSVAVVTDIYSQMAGGKKSGLMGVIKKVAGHLQKWYSTSFSCYVLLTEAMNEIVNPNNQPFVVMEALCDNQELQAVHRENRRGCQVILYAGGIEEQYGLKTLIDGFIRIPRKDIQLVLYGHGSFVNAVIAKSKEDTRIVYRGIANNEQIVEEEIKATLLVNPRLTTEELTKYSFPSKNMEYMSSGTPVLTTQLPGMPKEYYPYVFLFDRGETPEGFAEAIEYVLSLPEETLEEKGKLAREFVLSKKNKHVQTKKIIQLIDY